MGNLTAPFDIPQKEADEIRIAQGAVKIWRGGAVGLVLGTGYAVVLAAATAGMKFIGVALETNDNTLGTPGTPVYGNPGNGYSPYLRVKRRGVFPFNQSGLTQADVGLKCYFGSDDNTVSLTPSDIPAGEIVTVNEASGLAEVDITLAVFTPSQDGWIVLSGATDAIDPHNSGNYILTYAGVDAATLAAPTAVIDDGKTITVSSGGAHAHTITATGLLKTGSANVNLATFAAYAGAGLTLRAYNGLWQVISQIGITFT